MPEILWKSYIDFEIEQDESDRARDLYKRLLSKTQHVKVWMSYAQFELSVAHEDRIQQARHVYEEANKNLRNNPDKEHRLMLLEAWRDFEEENADEKSIAQVQDLMPKRVKRRRKIESADGEDGGWEEYFDYIFPEDESAKPNLKLLAMAKMWKKQKASGVLDEETAPAPAQEEEQRQPSPHEDSKKDDSDKESDGGEKEGEDSAPAAAAQKSEETNPDADDEDIKNEDSSSSSSSDEES